MNKPNPLSAYFRQPKHYTPLPSGGRWYPPGSLDMPASGELAVFPMTARDEISIKTPDALLSGQSTVDVIQSCIPNIKDAWAVPGVDVDAILISIRIATYGPKMEISPSCPECQEINSYDADLKLALGQSLGRIWDGDLTFGELQIHLKPLSYRELTDYQLKTFEVRRFMEELARAELEDKERVAKFNEGFQKLKSITIDMVLDSIESIELPDGTEVSDRGMLSEFIENAARDVFEGINNIVTDNQKIFRLTPLHIKCPDCGNEWEQALEFDTSNFFARNS